MTWKLAVIVATLATAATVSTQVLSTPKATSGEKGLTQVAGLKVGHFTLSERPTGCTVVLVDGAGAVGGISQRGAAPGTRETDLLDPLNMVERVNAIVLTGGSAYGLDAAQGVVRYLEEHKTGYPIAGTVVPIVPAAVLMDLGFRRQLVDQANRRLRLPRSHIRHRWPCRRRQHRRWRRRHRRQVARESRSRHEGRHRIGFHLSPERTRRRSDRGGQRRR